MLPVEFEIQVVEEWAHGNSLRAKIIGHYTPALPPDGADYDHHEIHVWHSDRVGWVNCDPRTLIGQVVWDFVNDSRDTSDWLELYRMAADAQWVLHPQTAPIHSHRLATR